MYKKGDWVKCKSHFNNMYGVVYKDDVLMVTCVDEDQSIIEVKKCGFPPINFFLPQQNFVNTFHKYFYTELELRQLKIKKLKECIE